jgi:hypothetical protein
VGELAARGFFIPTLYNTFSSKIKALRHGWAVFLPLTQGKSDQLVNGGGVL